MLQQKLLKNVEEMKKNIVSPFIQLIWDIISDPNSDHIISWSPNGTSFCITDPQAFADAILSKHFKHANISSFVRQLNMYNFHKNKTNTEFLEFFHKLFRRDAKQILVGIKRKPSEADHRQGQELLKVFLYKKYGTHHETKSESQNDHLKQDQGSENTTVDNYQRKLSMHLEDNQKQQPVFDFNVFTPRKILNIILVNVPESV